MSELDEWFPRDREPLPEPKPKEKVSPKVYGQRGEKWTRDYMLSLVGIKLEKRSDAPIDLGKVTVYPATNQLDHHGRVNVPWTNLAISVEVEVKTFEGAWPIGNLSSQQVDKLTQAANDGALAMLCLVAREGLEITDMWWIPWPQEKDGEYLRENVWTEFVQEDCEVYIQMHARYETFAAVMHQLRERVSGAFQAKSIREQDRDLLEDFHVYKEKGKWVLSDTHWMRLFFRLPAGQPRLFT